MSEEKRKVLEMLEAGSITQEDALRLLEALGEQEPEERKTGGEPVGKQENAAVPSLTLYPEGPFSGEGVQPEFPDLSADELPVPAGEGEASSQLSALPLEGQPHQCPLPVQQITELKVEWITGPVEVRAWEGNEVRVTEYSSRPLNESEQMSVTMENGRMHIRWVKESKGFFGWKTMGLSKHLVVELPSSMEESLEKGEIKAVSSDVRVDALSCGKLGVSSVSGKVGVTNLQARELEVSSVSGKVEAVGFSAGRVNVTSVSGRVNASGRGERLSVKTTSGAGALFLTELPRDVQMNSVSGRVELSIPEDPQGFHVQYTTVSGAFQSQFPLAGEFEKKKGQGGCGSQACSVKMSTVSGSMKILRA